MAYSGGYLSSCSETSFEAFMLAVQQDIFQEHDAALPDGVHELPAPGGPVSVVLDRPRRMLACHWLEPGDGGFISAEVFFVWPNNQEAKAGYRLTPNAAGKPAGLPPALSAWFEDNSPQEARVPCFIELAAMLASNGNISLSHFSLNEQLNDAVSEVSYLQSLLMEQREELRELREALWQTRQVLFSGSGASEPQTIPETSSTALADWCIERERDIVVLPRARNAVKKSQYEDPSLIIKALEILAGPYRLMRQGLLSKGEFEEHLFATGLRMAGSVAPNIAGSHGDQYFVRWSGRKRFLEQHLLKGGGRDERYCFRAYFFWCEDSGRAVVGHMPSHLENSLT
jgi:hypothetical protein